MNNENLCKRMAGTRTVCGTCLVGDDHDARDTGRSDGICIGLFEFLRGFVELVRIARADVDVRLPFIMHVFFCLSCGVSLAQR